MAQESDDVSRQHHQDHVDLTEQDNTQAPDVTIDDHAQELSRLVETRATLESYLDHITQAGKDGLDPTALKAMRISLNRRGSKDLLPSMESIDVVSTEDVAESLKAKLKQVGERIMEIINKLIERAKEAVQAIMSGANKVKAQAEEMLNRKGKSSNVSNELHDGDITIDNPVMLFAGDKFCLDDFKAEQEVAKFFGRTWPQYATDQISRLNKRIKDFDVAEGDLTKFQADSEFIGRHETIVKMIENVTLPGNRQVGFKWVALGPMLKEAEAAKPAPDSYSFSIRTTMEIHKTLKTNVAMMNHMSELFTAESKVLNELKTVSENLGQLEGRRGEAIWKASRDAVDTISREIIELIPKFWPNYDPIVKHLVSTGNARNRVCQQELERIG